MKNEKKIQKEFRNLMMEHRAKMLELIAEKDEVLEDSREARDLMSALLSEVERINNRVSMIDYELKRLNKTKED